MKMKKNAKPLSEATIGDLTDQKCGFFLLYFEFSKVEREERQAWLSCPQFMAEREFSMNEHSSFAVPLTDTGYKVGDELKKYRPLKQAHDTGRMHHDRPNMTAPPKAIGKRYKFTSGSERKRVT